MGLSLQLGALVLLLCGVTAQQHPLNGDPIPAEQVPLTPGAQSKPLVSSKALQNSINRQNLLSRAEKLFEIAKLSEHAHDHPTRVIGSQGHIGTLSYITDQLTALGDYYTVSNQSFPASTGSVHNARLILGNKVLLGATTMSLTPPTKNREPVYGPVVIVKNSGCDGSDYPDRVKGAIALIRRGACPFGAKSEHAGVKGAIAAVIYNNGENGGNPVYGTLGSQSANHVATFGVAKKDGEGVIEAIEGHAFVDGFAYIDGEVRTTLTLNIIAETIGGDPDNVVMLGAHSDSVAAGPGINDDGSGTLTLLEVAVQLAKFTVRNKVRFGWWGAEEEGLIGSDFYAANLPEKENMKIRLFMDYDMLGSPNFVYQVYNATDDISPEGSQALRDLYVDWYKDSGVHHSFIPFDGRSDYVGFIKAGIPAGGIATGAEGLKTAREMGLWGGSAGESYDPCYHESCDDVGNVNMTAWELNSMLVAHSVATYARSFDGFPRRTLVKTHPGWDKPSKYHGRQLVM